MPLVYQRSGFFRNELTPSREIFRKYQEAFLMASASPFLLKLTPRSVLDCGPPPPLAVESLFLPKSVPRTVLLPSPSCESSCGYAGSFWFSKDEDLLNWSPIGSRDASGFRWLNSPPTPSRLKRQEFGVAPSLPLGAAPCSFAFGCLERRGKP